MSPWQACVAPTILASICAVHHRKIVHATALEHIFHSAAHHQYVTMAGLPCTNKSSQRLSIIIVSGSSVLHQTVSPALVHFSVLATLSFTSKSP
jgi:hypothetical protein